MPGSKFLRIFAATNSKSTALKRYLLIHTRYLESNQSNNFFLPVCMCWKHTFPKEGFLIPGDILTDSFRWLMTLAALVSLASKLRHPKRSGFSVGGEWCPQYDPQGRVNCFWKCSPPSPKVITLKGNCCKNSLMKQEVIIPDQVYSVLYKRHGAGKQTQVRSCAGLFLSGKSVKTAINNACSVSVCSTLVSLP